MINVLNKHHFKNKSFPPNSVKIDRSTILGNPFSHLKNTRAKYKVKNREEAIKKYKEWIVLEIINKNLKIIKMLNNLANIYIKNKELNLICCCSPKKCHGEIIREIIYMIVKRKNAICAE